MLIQQGLEYINIINKARELDKRKPVLVVAHLSIFKVGLHWFDEPLSAKVKAGAIVSVEIQLQLSSEEPVAAWKCWHYRDESNEWKDTDNTYRKSCEVSEH